MICQNCQKEEATVHFTEVIDGKANELNLCKKCAEKKGISPTITDAFAEFISSLTNDQGHPEDDERCCPRCGLSFKELRKGGRLGCGECYTTFETSLSTLINNIHKGPKHTGKSPAGFEKGEEVKIDRPTSATDNAAKAVADNEAKIKELREKLKAAIAGEEYEKAAHLRDWIKDLES
jgi:protein arginine kinase activator